MMNSRERLMAVLERRVADRIPVDFCGTRRTGITASALYRLRQCLGMEVPVRLYDVYESLAEVDDAICSELSSDVLRLAVPVPLLKMDCLMDTSKKCWKSYALEDGTPVFIPNDFYPERELAGDLCLRDFQDRRFAFLKRGGYRFEPLTKGPGVLGMTPEQILQEIDADNPAVWMKPKESYWSVLKLATGTFSQTTDKALVMDGNPPAPFFAGLGRGDAAGWLERLSRDDAEVHAVLETWFSLWAAHLEKLLAATGDGLDVLVLSDDFSEVLQEADEKIILEQILPWYARGLELLREKKGQRVKVLWQSAGNVTPYVPALIAMGVNAVGLVDLMPVRMNPLALKKDFGDGVVLWGGCCPAEDLQEKSEGSLLRETREKVAILNEGGGYVHALSGNILPKTPPENILNYFTPRD
ncbi:MAG: uroporphyrinogen decarboxylase family protein [Planctomycetia bacterium]|nr:uroporphyrinogen decarboxylase family protein [Planctomycetia bacterium]